LNGAGEENDKAHVFRNILCRQMNKNTIQRARYHSRGAICMSVLSILDYASFRSQPFAEGRGRSSV